MIFNTSTALQYLNLKDIIRQQRILTLDMYMTQDDWHCLEFFKM